MLLLKVNTSEEDPITASTLPTDLDKKKNVVAVETITAITEVEITISRRYFSSLYALLSIASNYLSTNMGLRK